MMKLMVLASVAAFGLSSLAKAEDTSAKTGYAPGALASAEIVNGNLQTAEARLNDARYVARDDPARLINLGHVYAKSGRFAAARDLYVAAYRAPSEELLLANGRTQSSRQVARTALEGLRPALAAR